MQDLRLSIIVINHDTRELLRRCLASIFQQEGDGREIIVLDNASCDGSAEMVRAEFGEAILLALERNDGFSVAVNQGAALARGRYLLLLNADVEILPGQLEEMLDVAIREEARCREPGGLGALGFRQMDGKGGLQLTWGYKPTLLRELKRKILTDHLDGSPTLSSRLLEVWMGQGRRAVDWVSGSCMLMPRASFEAVGPFDEGYFLFFEDIDWCLRARRAGYGIVYAPSPGVFHAHGASARIHPGRAEKSYRQSQLKFWRDHRGKREAGMVQAYLLAKYLANFALTPARRRLSRDMVKWLAGIE